MLRVLIEDKEDRRIVLRPHRALVFPIPISPIPRHSGEFLPIGVIRAIRDRLLPLD
jgi:hypothetical protein